MKNFTPILFFLFFALTSTVSAQTHCCCPFCPTTCVVNAFGPGGCIVECSTTCGNATGAEGSNDAGCLGTSCNPLPIELAAFNLRASNDVILLKWSTETETNNEGFEVQRVSGLSMTWETLAFIPGAGTSISAEYYEYEDKTAPPGVNYYRLKQIDFDRTESLSPMKAARLEEDNKYSVWPTLARNHVLISINGSHNHNQKQQIYVFDMMGRLISEEVFVDGLTLDVSTYPTGSYIVNLYSNGVKETYKFMKVE